MATKTATSQETIETTDDVLSALAQLSQQMGQMNQTVNQRLDKAGKVIGAIGKRIAALEAKPDLKPRVVQPPTPQPPAPSSMPDQAPMMEPEEFETYEATCYRIDVTKVRSPNFKHCWKLLLRIRGYNRPVTIVGWNGPAELVEMMADVWPNVSLDIFDEAGFDQKYAERLAEDSQANPPIIYSQDVHFKVEWYRTQPNYRGHTYVKALRVYPI